MEEGREREREIERIVCRCGGFLEVVFAIGVSIDG
jgi:hypothetical protein